jgi:hypothetical protein
MWQLNRIPIDLSIRLVTFVAGLVDLSDGGSGEFCVFVLDRFERFLGGA